uniref:Uncharacterized protein n=1 Tax=Anguilla anguilla TaxID=7936 RepID=A0A0E9U6A1_ANGAN
MMPFSLLQSGPVPPLPFRESSSSLSDSDDTLCLYEEGGGRPV